MEWNNGLIYKNVVIMNHARQAWYFINRLQKLVIPRSLMKIKRRSKSFLSLFCILITNKKTFYMFEKFMIITRNIFKTRMKGYLHDDVVNETFPIIWPLEKIVHLSLKSRPSRYFSMLFRCVPRCLPPFRRAL